MKVILLLEIVSQCGVFNKCSVYDLGGRLYTIRTSESESPEACECYPWPLGGSMKQRVAIVKSRQDNTSSNAAHVVSYDRQFLI